MAINTFKNSICSVLKSDFTASSSGNRTVDLPYHGFVEKDQVRWRDMPSHTLDALSQFLDAGLVLDAGHEYTLTMEGWRWYVNMMYYSMPLSQKSVLDNFIIHNLRQPGRRITAEQITFQ
jgi:hypothetical protein